MTKQEIKNKAVTFATLVNSHLEIIAKAKDQFDSDIALRTDETFNFLEELFESDGDLIALQDKYKELLEKLDL